MGLAILAGQFLYAKRPARLPAPLKRRSFTGCGLHRADAHVSFDVRHVHDNTGYDSSECQISEKFPGFHRLLVISYLSVGTCGMAAATDNVRRMRLPFTPGAAIVAVLLG